VYVCVLIYITRIPCKCIIMLMNINLFEHVYICLDCICILFVCKCARLCVRECVYRSICVGYINSYQ